MWNKKNKKQQPVNQPLENKEEVNIPTSENIEESAIEPEVANEPEISESASESTESKDLESEELEEKTPEPLENKEEAVAFVPLNEKKQFKIMITKTSGGLKKGKEHTVSGNVANILIKKGVAKLA
jgi:hypothetical protein